MKKDYNDLKWVFDKFIPQDIYTKIWFRWYEKITLGNCISKTVTIMFLDIMWFTKISENFTPERSLLLLNIYFDWIWDLVYRRWWYIDKFLWDGIMIIFEQENTDEALMCAIDIQEFIKKFQISAVWSKINIWIWINTWDVIMWTIWTKKRMDATVIWDNVNIASRIQSVTRRFNKEIIISDNTYDLITDKNKFSIEKIWEEFLRWKEKPVMLYSMENYYKIEL
jgi:two-component system sensor histidine kinase ChiS